jgi:hypothetical protein
MPLETAYNANQAPMARSGCLPGFRRPSRIGRLWTGSPAGDRIARNGRRMSGEAARTPSPCCGSLSKVPWRPDPPDPELGAANACGQSRRALSFGRSA